jgi:hypothetical protein
MTLRTLIELEGLHGYRATLHGRGQGDCGAVLTEVSGIYDAPVRTIQTRTAFQTGASHGGVRWDAREITLRVAIGAPLLPAGREGDTEELESEFLKAWSYSEDSRLWVTTSGSSRSLDLRLVEAPTVLTRRDPKQAEVVELELRCLAGVPWWAGPDLVGTWVSQNDGVESGTVTVSNPTDRPMWLRWTITAPGRWTLPDYSWYGAQYFSAADLPSDIADLAATSTTRQIVMPELNSGTPVDIDTDPFEEQVVRVGFPNFWALMGGVTFMFPVPPYTPATELPVSVDGPAGSTVLVHCPRNWTRPWGKH